MTGEVQQPLQRICGKCGGLFIGNNLASIDKVYVTIGPPIQINKYKQQVCSKADNRMCLTKSLLNKVSVQTQRPEYGKGNLTSSVIDNITTTVLKDNGVVFSDRYVSINWIEEARKSPVSVDTKYSCTTYIKGIDMMLSITIQFMDSTNEGYLTFLRPELIEDMNLNGLEFNLFEGGNRVANAVFK